MNNKSVQLDMSCTVNGRVWKLFTFEYKTQDGIFCGYLYALDFEHASYLLEELKVNAELKGEMISSLQ